MRRRERERRLDAITVEEWREIWEAGTDFDAWAFDPDLVPQMREAVRVALAKDRTPSRRGRPDVVDLFNGEIDDDEIG